MKKLISSTLALLTLSLGVGNAQVSGFNVGYCQGEMGPFPNNEEFFSNGAVQKQVWVDAAILVPADKIHSLVGNELREVKAALCSKLNIDSLAVWVSESLDGPVLTTDTIAGSAIVKNWNTVALSHPLTITEQTGALYVGMSYHQKSTNKGLSALETGFPGYSLFVRYNKSEWADFSQQYSLALEAMFYGDNLPKYDLTLEAITLPRDYVVDNGQLTFTARVRNNATCTITGFDALCSIDGIDEVYTAHCDSVLTFGQVCTATLTISPTGLTTADPKLRTMTVTLDNLAEGQDEVMSDNTLSGSFAVSLHSYVRNVLVEDFTTEKCSNCPRVGAFIDAALESPEFAGRLNTVEHHAGYYTDIYTIPSDNEWLWFFDNVYAPAIMMDRTALPGEITPCRSESMKETFMSEIRERMRELAFVSLKVTGVIDTEAQQIHVKVTGNRSKTDFTRQPARITLILTETNLVTTSQAGYAGEYVHINVGRRVSSTWGQVLEWDGDDYTYEYTFGYNQNYKLQNLGILAFIHDYDPTDKTKCEVANSMAITYADFVTPEGLNAIESDAASRHAVCYDLNGRLVKEPQVGLYVVDGKKVLHTK